MGKVTMNHSDQINEEINTWCIEDDVARHEKIQRERIRHYKLVKDLLLDKLDTSLMDIVEIGGGPIPVSDLIPYKSRLVIDPATDAYKEYFHCPDHINARAEGMIVSPNKDLVISTNSLDHVEFPLKVMIRIDETIKPGGFFAVMCAENNALTNPHPCHEHNLTSKDLHNYFDRDYETVWELNYDKDKYRYGWGEYQGKRGQPAFAILFRRCTGYS